MSNYNHNARFIIIIGNYVRGYFALLISFFFLFCYYNEDNYEGVWHRILWEKSVGSEMTVIGLTVSFFF